MDRLLDHIERLAREHDKPDPKLLERHNIKLGLRNADGSGVIVGLTSKGLVIGYEKNPKANGADLRDYKVRPVEGKLYYCGYDIRSLINGLKTRRFGFEETAYLLLTGTLPCLSELEAFSKELNQRSFLPEAAQRFIIHDSAHPDQMNALHRAVSAMSLFDPQPNPHAIRDITRQCVDLIAKIPTIVAYNYQAIAFTRGVSKGLLLPQSGLSVAENFFYLLNGALPTSALARLLDLCLVLHAEHGGGNNSTFTVRVVSSSQANTYMAISSGIASLSGHLHGGANEAVVRMMRYIKENLRDWKDEEALEACLQKILHRQGADKSGKLYGIGHAVYTLSDPRAVILEEKAMRLAKEVGRLDEFRLYQKVARIGSQLLAKEKGKTVAPNVDFYSGFVYEAMGIPMELFTPIFAMARVAGWSAHRLEQLIQQRLIRPAYLSSIQEKQTYVPLVKRH
ncbi:MAG: citrate synthase [Candidatus Omnitrophica bacterium]|nr:citrate synthase [Candidatus Omnitrophota bacterium]